MAITAAIALSDATLTSGMSATATLTVSNSASAAVLVTGIQPTVTPAGLTSQSVAVAVGQPMWGAAFPQSVAALGSTKFSWPVTPNAPTAGYGLAMPATFVYDVGATVYTNDGAITTATPATLTVTNPPLT